MIRVDDVDLAAEDPAKVAAARARFALEEADDEGFALGYAHLEAVFGPANEIERREVLEAWRQGPRGDRIRARYHLVLARDGDGRLAAVRDCFTAVDRSAGRVVALLSHTLVLPPFRRTGLAALLRALPATFSRADAALEGIAPREILLVAEMEPVDPAKPETMIRLVAYGRAGFRIVPPERVPYAQPDFRDLARLGVPARPVPLLLVVRQVGAEDRDALAPEQVGAIFDHLGTIHRPATQGDQLAEIRRFALRGIGGGPIPLRRPPAEAIPAAMTGLLREDVLPLFPAEWRPIP